MIPDDFTAPENMAHVIAVEAFLADVVPLPTRCSARNCRQTTADPCEPCGMFAGFTKSDWERAIEEGA